MFRTPEEPNPKKHPEVKGFVLPEILDFADLYQTKNETSSRKALDDTVNRHIEECVDMGLRLTDPRETVNCEHVTTKVLPIKLASGKIQETEIRVESVSVAGTSDKDMKGVRHIAKLTGVKASYAFDVYNRLNYTDAIDKFTYLVEQIDSIDVPKDNKHDIAWNHVAYTADRLVPMFAVRDFVTFDFVSEAHMMLNSRSCKHPLRPQTPIPTFWSFCGDKQTYRVPLQYFLRIIPDKDDPDGSCTVVQFQYSDIGGVVPPASQTKAVIDFGLDNLPKFFAIVLRAKEKGLELGVGSKGYLKNPLEPCWRQDIQGMIPGL
mmetsp:Transcript_1575/g.2236  ORF Transcript_1575/g.2236 Transcript_1575/m.2236 type:complete len:319 (+) Transcript_1575:265-1221(+)|eukprot:CAMPEP_0198149386 /NCGR_PEP_ID=MMETSP1443-20131203/46269_1 /TAXON_ID=186043 /ORGANISM="Entomoneis sp., Strain CCMP2396" /LENGTH=318 /DNA_ID=CAMNT_0043814397 /DNA_START=145 /DNA_END=1101 /DNA_ORIENTATION=+